MAPPERPICFSGRPDRRFASTFSRDTPFVSGTKITKKMMKRMFSPP
jgi:hypothetical protein